MKRIRELLASFLEESKVSSARYAEELLTKEAEEILNRDVMLTFPI